MVPQIWVELEQLPLTPNGKVNRKALPEPDMSGLLQNQFVAPRNEKDIVLCEIWQEVLGVEKIGIQDDFFELGGHSLTAMRLVAAISRELEIEFEIRDLFQYPNICALSDFLST